MKCFGSVLALLLALGPLRSLAQNTAQAPPTAPLPAQNLSPQNSVVVTGTFEPVSIDELDRAVSSLPVRSINLLLNSWLDALELDSSVDIESRAPNGVQTDVSIRGATFGQTLVLVNGIRVNDVQTGHHDLDLPLPLLSIDHVEVLRGSGSTLYGSDAVGGVVNVITQPPERSEVLLRAAAGNFGVDQESGLLSYAGPLFSEQVTFSRDRSTGFEFDRDYRNLSFGSETHWRTPWGATDLVAGYADKPFGANGFYGDYPSWEDTKTWLAALTQNFGANTTAVFSYRRHSDLFVLFRDDPPIYTNHHYDDSYLAELRRSDSLWTNARLHYGAEFDRESVVSTNLGDHARTRGSAYASLDIRALKRFSFSIGAREDAYTGAAGGVFGEFNPNVAAGYWLNSRVRLRAGVSRAFRLPTYTDLYYSDPANLGNALLKPEHAWSFEGGVEFQISSGWRAEATVFQRRDYDGIDYVRQSADEVWQAENFDRLRFTGFEGALTTRLGNRQQLALRFTGIHGYENQFQGYESKYAFNFPVESGVAEYRASIGKILFRTRFGAERRINQSPYAVWDAYTAWSRAVVSPFFQLTNITNTSYQEIPGVAVPGRAIVGGVEIRAWR